MIPSIKPPAAAPEIDYPDSDGQPMGETGWHIAAILYLYGALRDHFAHRDDVYVAADMFLYYQEGLPSAVKAPDCMVIFGVPSTPERGSFKTWVEAAAPTVIFEITSESTFRVDVGEKLDVYAQLGVPEYYVFDPLSSCFDAPLFGYRLRDGRYEQAPLEADGGLTSPALGLRLVPEEALLRLIDLQTGRPMLTGQEKSAEVNAERQRAKQERQRADALAAEVEQLRALLAGRDPKPETWTTED
ncbi:MAG: Uma2 family endonuclease [Isosphaeraceae bacterium]